MRDVVFDIEADGLLDATSKDKPAATKIHTLVLWDLQTGEILSTTDDSDDYPDIAEGLEVLSKAERLYGHNVIRYDIPLIEKLYPEWEYEAERVFDTIIMTRLRWAHIKRSDFGRAKRGALPSHLIGRHSLEAWGHRIGEYKVNYERWCEKHGIEEPWAEWRPEMQKYCEQDVAVNVSLIHQLRKAGLPSQALEIDLELGWYLAQQERNGWPVDERALQDLIGKLSDRKAELEEQLIDHFGTWCVPKDDPETGWKPKRNNSRYGYVEGVPTVRIEWKEFNPNSTVQLADRLQELHGWEPKEFTPSGQPKMDEAVIKSLPDTIPVRDEIVEYLMIDKRLGQAANGKQAWLKHLTDEGYQGGQLTGMKHIHHSIAQVTVTHRHRHSHPNLGQVPKVGSPYGKECRQVFTVPAGWKLVGSDASGLELRCLAHYLGYYDGGEYGETLLESDVHTRHRKALELPEETPDAVYSDGRDTTKTFGYAYLYGAGNEKLGSIIRPSADENTQLALGKEYRAKLETNIAALGDLQEAVKKKSRHKDYVRLPDGRRAYIRAIYSSLNTLLQGAGSIIVKAWIVEANRRLMERFDTPPGGGWEYTWAAVGYIHDEVQIAVREEHAEEVAEILEDAITSVADLFEWRLPLEAESDIGANWAETH